jgi:ADP-heptose:LPS heptosyltransferase
LWPTSNFASLARAFSSEGLVPLIAWGPGEEERAGEVAALSGGKAVMLPKTSIGALAALSARARVFIGSDTGPTHVAALLGTPTVGIYGPTSHVTNGPFGPHVAVAASKAGCAPCWKRECAHASCMKMIDWREVFELGRSFA